MYERVYRREMILNGNKVVVDWTGTSLVVDISANTSRGSNIYYTPALNTLSEDDIHTILRAINEVRRERQGELLCLKN